MYTAEHQSEFITLLISVRLGPIYLPLNWAGTEGLLFWRFWHGTVKPLFWLFLQNVHIEECIKKFPKFHIPSNSPVLISRLSLLRKHFQIMCTRWKEESSESRWCEWAQGSIWQDCTFHISNKIRLRRLIKTRQFVIRNYINYRARLR